jgi:hypothetical protein
MTFINGEQWYDFNFSRENKTTDDNLKSWTTLFEMLTILMDNV